MDIAPLIITHFVGLIKLKEIPDSREFLARFADSVTQELQLTVLDRNSYAFTPIGQTLIYVLSQSHIAIHTWPEYRLLHVDLVSCKHISNTEFTKAITDSLTSSVVENIEIKEYLY